MLNGLASQTLHQIEVFWYLSESVMAHEFDWYIWEVLPSIALSAVHSGV